MKVECQQCGAAFTVADGKVAGRSLKLRCKKCGGSIAVDGTSLRAGASSAAPAVDPTEAVSDQAEPTWHIAVGDATQGPYTLEELASYYVQGSVESTTLVFCDGWHDWRPAGEVAQLQQLVRTLAPPAHPVPTAVTTQTLSGAGNAPVMGRDPFADSADETPRVSVEDMHAPGKTREGTVQFSLDQIRALSSVSSPSLAPAAPVAALGFASGDGSGLIDMRAIAAAEVSSSAFSPIAGHDVSPLVSTMAPLSLPVSPGPRGVDGRTKVIAGVVAFGFAIAGGVAVLALTRTAPPPAIAAPVAMPSAMATAPATAAAPEPIAPPEAAPAPHAAPAAAVVPTQPTEVAVNDAADTVQARSSSHSSQHKASHHAAAKSEAKAEPSASSKPSKAAKTGSLASLDNVLASSDKPAAKKSGGTSIDDLLDGAISGKRSAPKAEPAPAHVSSLPMTPGRDEMLAALGKAKAKAAKCKGTGVATAAITVTGSTGRASSVSVSGVEGPGKACVESAVKSTPFPKFQRDTFEVKFPFKLKG